LQKANIVNTTNRGEAENSTCLTQQIQQEQQDFEVAFQNFTNQMVSAAETGKSLNASKPMQAVSLASSKSSGKSILSIRKSAGS
jgi:hypothetical protein